MSEPIARLAGDLEPRVDSAARAGPCWPSVRARRGSCQISIAAAWRSARTSVRLPSSILKALCSRGCACAKAASAAAVSGCVVERLALERGFGLAGAPRHGGDAAERDARVAHRAAVEVERDRGGGQREFVGLAVADLEIERAARPTAPPASRKRGDQLARRQRGLDVRRVARLAMQLGERNVARAVAARRSRPSHRARSAPARNRRDRSRCMLAGAEHGVRAVDAVERGAAGAGIALVAVARRTCRGNRGSACAAAHCRRASPCCGSARWRRAAATARSPG